VSAHARASAPNRSRTADASSSGLAAERALVATTPLASANRFLTRWSNSRGGRRKGGPRAAFLFR
jgi:hypothetical protein